MNTIAGCQQCGQDYKPTELLRGLCPVCLFAHALPAEVADSFASEQTERFSRVHFIPPKIGDLAEYFPQLEIQELAGHGGMSAVYRAHQRHLDRTVALKVLPKEIAESHGGVERFQREAQTLAQLNHPNIVNVYDAGQAGPWCYIVMEFVQGPNLRQLLGESKLPASDVLRIVSGICDGLQYAHDQGVVHRDVKPENVLLDSAGLVKLVDFGLAKLLNPSPSSNGVTQTHQVMGTPNYLAPEQAATPARVDHRADLYSLGVMMYEMLTGEIPRGHFEPPSLRTDSDPALDAVVLQAMSRDPLRRYQQARELQRAMASPPTMKSKYEATKSGSAWQTVLNELMLSGFSILAVLVGILLLKDRRLEISMLLFLLSFLLARVNVSAATRWRDLSPIQTMCVPILVSSYILLGLLLFIAPALLVLLFANLPMFADLEHWKFFGRTFAEADRNSFVTPYWLRVCAVLAFTTGTWCCLLSIVLRMRFSLLHTLFHPAADESVSAIVRVVAVFAALVLAPCGFVLLYASWS